jgi:hypothetical protein
VELYEQTQEPLKFRKSKKERGDKDSTQGSVTSRDQLSASASQFNTYYTLVGHVNIPVSSIDSSQPTEKWYKLEGHASSTNDDDAKSAGSGNASSSTNLTSNFGKDSISVRIKAKYQSVDILPISCYKRLVDVNQILLLLFQQLIYNKKFQISKVHQRKVP